MGEVWWSDVKRIAEGEIGYHEEGNNWTKYAKDLDAISYFNGPKQCISWCATFVAWSIWKCVDPDAKGTALAADVAFLGMQSIIKIKVNSIQHLKKVMYSSQRDMDIPDLFPK